jgi:hypothetical protein
MRQNSKKQISKFSNLKKESWSQKHTSRREIKVGPSKRRER